MDDAMTGQVTAAAAQLYEQFYLPALFAQWPGRLLELAGVRAGQDVLDVACGTGVLARAAMGKVGPSGTVCGVDVNQGMLAVAARCAPGVTWRLGRAESLPVPDGSADHVFCQFGLMFVTDRRAAAREMVRAARQGGSVCVATWAALAETPGYAAMIDLLEELFGPAPARALDAPFSIGTPEELEEILQPEMDAVVVHQVDGVARFPSVDDWVTTDARAWTLTDLLDDQQIDELRVRARDRLRPFCTPSGTVEFPAPALVALAQV